jgi:hypothetical protein
MSSTSFQFGLICVVVFTGLCIIFFGLLFRHHKLQLAHSERMAALEKGIAVPTGQAAAPWSPRVYLLRGLVWTFVGIALTLGLFVVAVASHTRHIESAEFMSIRARTVSQNLQIPIDQARQIVEKDDEERAKAEVPPIALAFFGLIPLGVGLAYLVFYRSEASKGALSPRQ